MDQKRLFQERITACLKISVRTQKKAEEAKKESALYQKQMAESIKKTKEFISKSKGYQDNFTELQKSLLQHQNDLMKFQEAIKGINEDSVQFLAKIKKGNCSIGPSYSRIVEVKDSAVQCESLKEFSSQPVHKLEHDQKASKNVSKKSKQKSKEYQPQSTDYQSELRQSQLMYESEHKVVQHQKEELKEFEQKLTKTQVDLVECQNELKLCHTTLAKLEGRSFESTNAFTTADEGSVYKLKDAYRNMQHNFRPAAVRAHKKLHCNIPLQLVHHGMMAYDKAKELVLKSFEKVMDTSTDRLLLETDMNFLSPESSEAVIYYCILVLKTFKLSEESKQSDDKELAYTSAKQVTWKAFIDSLAKTLYHMQPAGVNSPLPQSNRTIRHCMQIINSFHEDQKLSEDSVKIITQTLFNEYNSLTKGAPPKQVEDYYSKLAKFTWDCVARTIPIVMSTEITQFDQDLHEVKDGHDEAGGMYDGKEVVYIYPVLFTSNRWPREVALKGKVTI